jgi:hypothetical protein
MGFQPDDIAFVGWEKNSKGIFCPKYVDLSKTMDSKKFVLFFKVLLQHS